jgi:hypothetical protein
MTRIAILANLIAWSIVVSQPISYLLVFTNAQRALSAPAFIELRQRINAVMTRRVPVIYSITLVTVLVLLVLSWRIESATLLATTAIALLCLLADVAFMLRENVPINGVIDGWSTTRYPQDWETYRTSWFAIFAYRQVILGVGFVSLLVGAVYQR